MIGTVRKLHKVSEKPTSTLGFSTPGVILKGNPPPSVGSALPRSKHVASHRGATGNRGRSGTGVFVPAKREWPARYRRGVVDGLA